MQNCQNSKKKTLFVADKFIFNRRKNEVEFGFNNNKTIFDSNFIVVQKQKLMNIIAAALKVYRPDSFFDSSIISSEVRTTTPNAKM